MLHSNLLTVAPLYQETTSGASPAGQELEASSPQSRLDGQNQLFKEQAASDAAPSSGSLPMDMLDARINGWIKSEQAAGEKLGQPQTGT
jgi:hypothetical protein